jgi:hypothetical protein
MIKNIRIEKYVINEKIDEEEFSEDFGDYEYEPLDDDPDYDVTDEDEEDHLCYLIRSMFNNYGLNVQVERNDLDITVNIFLEIKERMKNILKAFDVVYKMRKDILPQYDSQMELFETKSGYPVLSFEFYYDSGDKDDNLPF